MDSRPPTAAAAPTTRLGVAGYTFADLHDPERLESLYARFCEGVQAEDPALWARWDAYRRDPDAPAPPVERSNLIVEMAPHVSRFLERLFDVERAASGLRDATRDQDDLFRFKVDFVRRRVLPLVKSGAPVCSKEDEAAVARLIGDAADRELAIARVGCALLDAQAVARRRPTVARRKSRVVSHIA